MSLIDGYVPSVIDDFLGANYRGETSDVRPPWLLRAKNREFEQGYTRTRGGFYPSPVRNGGSATNFAGFHHQQYGNISYVVDAYESAGTIQAHIGAFNASPSTGALGLGIGATFAGIANRIYGTTFASGYDTGSLFIMLSIDTSPALATVWAKPLTFAESLSAGWTFTVTNPAGSATPGSHNLALLFTSHTGFVTRPSPVLTEFYGSFGGYATVTSGVGNMIRTVVTPAAGFPWPTRFAKVSLLATTTRNLSRHFIVPNTELAVPGGTLDPLTFDLNIPDSALSLATPADRYEDVIYTGYKKTNPNDPPIAPYYVFNCGERLGYFFKDAEFGYAMAFSDPSDYEHLTFDRHVIYLPQRAKPIAGKSVQGTIYIFTDDATYAYVDTGGEPVTWPKERVVDSKIGTHQPYSFTLDSSGNGFIGHSSGLYAFAGGQYSRIPMSYYQESEWKQIDWVMSLTKFVSIANDKDRFRVLVCAPNQAAAANVRSLHTWNYLKGFDASVAAYSDYEFANSNLPKFMGIVVNTGDAISPTRHVQLWIGFDTGPWMLGAPTNCIGGSAVFYKDTFNSVAYGIQPELRFPFLPERPADDVNEHHIVRVRVRGTGTLIINVYGMDDVLSVGPFSKTLSLAAAKEEFFRFSLLSQSASAKLTMTAAAGDNLELSFFAHYWKFYAKLR